MKNLLQKKIKNSVILNTILLIVIVICIMHSILFYPKTDYFSMIINPDYYFFLKLPIYAITALLIWHIVNITEDN